MWSGHFYLPDDSDFSHIEKRKNSAISITTPDEYLHLMKTAKKNKPFHVQLMKWKDFLKISCLTESFSRPKRVDDKTAIKIMSIHKMEYKRVFFDIFTDLLSTSPAPIKLP